MATNSDLNGTVGKSSAEAFTFECDACKLDDNIEEAKYFCPECEDYLCQSCETHHKKVKATRFHEIVSIDEAAIKVMKEKRREGKPSVKMICSCGQDEETSFYCQDHDACFCLLCKSVKHRRCNASSLEEVSHDPMVLTEFTAMVKKFNELDVKTKDLKAECQKQKDVLRHLDEKCKDDIKKFRSKLNIFLDECQRKNLQELQKVIEKLTDHLEDNVSAVTSTQQLLAKDDNFIREVGETNDKRQAFIVSTQLRKSIKEFDAVLEDVKNRLDIPNISFDHNNTLDSLQTTLKGLGRIQMSYNVKGAKNIPVLVDAVVKHRTQVDINILSKEKKPAITGLGFLPDGELLIADHASNTVALLNADLQIKETLECEGPPYDIAITSKVKAVVTLPYQQTLLYIQTDPKLHIVLKRGLKNRCWGVAYCKENIYVACNFSGENPEILELAEESGNFKRSIKCYQMGGIACSYIFNLATNQDGTRLYVTDYWSHQMLCLSIDGELIFSYSDADMKYPRGILIDAAGNALVCCEASSNVHIVKSDGTKHKILLKSEDGIQTPFSVNYRICDGMLVIGCWEKTSVLAFLLKP